MFGVRKYPETNFWCFNERDFFFPSGVGRVSEQRGVYVRPLFLVGVGWRVWVGAQGRQGHVGPIPVMLHAFLLGKQRERSSARMAVGVTYSGVLLSRGKLLGEHQRLLRRPPKVSAVRN